MNNNKKFNILLVEDNPFDRIAFEEAIVQNSPQYEFKIVNSITDAKVILKSVNFDIILTDHYLGDGTAFDILDIIKDIPIIFITGTGDEKIAVAALKKGVYDYVIKDVKDRNYLKKIPILIKRVIERRKSSELQRKLFDDLKEITFALDEHSIVVTTDIGGKIIYANKKFCEISKYSIDELIGKNHRIVNSGYHSEKFMENLWGTIKKGKVWKGEIKNKAKNGSFYWVASTIFPLIDQKGKVFQYIAIRTDITQQKKVEEELLEYQGQLEKLVESQVLELKRTVKDLKSEITVRKEADEKLKNIRQSAIDQEKRALLGRLTLGLIHEIKNHLNPIGFLDIIKEKLNDEDREYIEHINTGKKRILSIINDFYRLSKNEKANYTIAAGSISKVINETVFIAKMDPDTKDIEIILDFRYEDQVLINADKIIQVMLNLIRNASQAINSAGNGRISIKTGKDKGLCYIQVIDNGSGIEESKLADIWKPFFTTKGEKGMGIGLKISKQIIEEHSGNLTCTSKINEGTTFTFTLPIPIDSPE